MNGHDDIFDPWEATNRSVFSTYLVLDKHAFRPAAEAYGSIPAPIRKSIGNALRNLDGPDILINDLLRGRMRAAATTLVRTAINSTAGIGGLFEVAADLGLPPHSDDFGKTLATYGIREGPYLFTYLGPSTVRDLAGMVIDLFLSPFMLMGGNGKYVAIAGEFALKALDTRERNIDTLDSILLSSADSYATLRSDYLQSRRAEIRGEMGEEEALPEF